MRIKTQAFLSHLFIFATFLTGCSDSSQYNSPDSAPAGILGGPTMQILASTVFKSQPKASEDLKDNEKCNLYPGNSYILTGHPVESTGQHFRVYLAVVPKGCNYSSGYVFGPHVRFPDSDVRPSPYVFPLKGGALGSAWCVCRNIGTSPHIGQDFVKSSNLNSVAVNRGTVESVGYDAVCGYSVYFRDVGGARWRYLHLDKPWVAQGQALTPGQTIGSHSSYPRNGCGTGPHLHLERLSAGAFQDSAAGKSCQFGYRQCNYDPVKPWRGGLTELTFADWKSNEGSDLTEASDAASARGVNSDLEKTLGCSKMQPRITETSESVKFPNPSAERLSPDLNHQLRVIEGQGGQRYLELSVAWKDQTGENIENSCQDGKNCIVSIDFLMRKKDGKLFRYFRDQGLRNRKVFLSRESRFCVGEQFENQYVLRIKTLQGSEREVAGVAQLE
jgi:hypothetical protein